MDSKSNIMATYFNTKLVCLILGASLATNACTAEVNGIPSAENGSLSQGWEQMCYGDIIINVFLIPEHPSVIVGKNGDTYYTETEVYENGVKVVTITTNVGGQDVMSSVFVAEEGKRYVSPLFGNITQVWVDGDELLIVNIPEEVLLCKGEIKNLDS